MAKIISLLLFLQAYCLLTIPPRLATLSKDVNLDCHGTRCYAKFHSEAGIEHNFKLQLAEHQSILSKDASIRHNGRMLNKEQAEAAVSTRSYHGIEALASAEIQKMDDGSHSLVHGIFSTQEGPIIFERSPGESGLRKNRRRQLWTNAWGTLYTDPELFYNPTVPGSCYPNDTRMNVAQFSVIADWGFVQDAVGSTTDSVTMTRLILESLQYSFSFMRLIWAAQLNIRIEIINIEIADAASPSPLNWSPTTTGCGTALDAFDGLTTYIRDRSGDPSRWGGGTILVSKCYGGTDFAGVALPSSFCAGTGTSISVATSDPVTVAHEMGHMFGSEHSFENGVGTTGGIMDVGGSGFYAGSPQFHPGRRDEVCELLSSRISNKCKWLKLSSTGSCGDGVLSPDEECECLPSADNRPVTACGDCNMCQLVNEEAECSAVAAIRQPNDIGHIQVTAALLASPECCDSNNEVPMAKSCLGDQNMCMAGGYCNPICTALGLRPCGVSGTGCRQKCIVQGLCVESSPKMTAKNITLNSVSDGTTCFAVPGTNQLGKCMNGLCYPADDSDPGGTLTMAPATPIPSTKQPTTRTPGLSTPTPTVRVTKAPTSRPSRAPSTQRPTVPPTVSTVVCPNFKRKGVCNRRQPCVWSGGRCYYVKLG